MLADNKIALNAGWDEELLAEELRALLDPDLGIAVDLTGFSIAEIDALIELDAPEEDRNPRDDRLPVTVPARVRPGDLWALGPHRLICGDSSDPATVERLMAGSAARMVFTDPPYNLPVDGHVGGAGRLRHREFAMASGEMSPAAFADAIRDVSGRGEIVLDLFGGSGSTLIAAEKTGRRARLAEIDPAYGDLILARWEDYAKDEALLLERREESAPEISTAEASHG